MKSILIRALVLLLLAVSLALPLRAQQKGQYMPGQFGLNAGVQPAPGFTYVPMEINYDTNTFNDANGKALPPKPNLSLWVIENWLIYVPHNAKFLGGRLIRRCRQLATCPGTSLRSRTVCFPRPV